jgi:hypothetical protein
MPGAIVKAMSSRTGWIAGAIILGAIALVVLVRPAPPADSPAASPPPPEPAAIPDEPRRGVDVGEEIAAPAPSTRELPAQAAAPSEAGEQNREPAPSIRTAPDWAANYAAEPIDPEWAPRAQTDIVSRFAEQPGLELIALQVECRTTMCQVQMTQPSSAAVEPLAREPPMRLLNTVGMQLLSLNVLSIQTNMMTSVAYVVRPGHEPALMLQRAADPREQR